MKQLNIQASKLPLFNERLTAGDVPGDIIAPYGAYRYGSARCEDGALPLSPLHAQCRAIIETRAKGLQTPCKTCGTVSTGSYSHEE